jgi:hypothetical protein
MKLLIMHLATQNLFFELSRRQPVKVRLLASLCLFVRPSVSTRDRLNEFSLNLILRSIHSLILTEIGTEQVITARLISVPGALRSNANPGHQF